MIKPIETHYNGYRFRSRLEARWAVFFDTLGIKYEYEPEGFDLGDGLYYLPDFRVKCYGCRGSCGDEPFDLWIEVKGKMTEEDARKIRKFAGKEITESTEYASYSWFKVENPVLIVREIPNSYDGLHGELNNYEPMDGTRVYPWNYELIDGDHFAAYPAVDDGRFYLDGDDSNYMTMNTDVVERAFQKALQARFEHGESGRN